MQGMAGTGCRRGAATGREEVESGGQGARMWFEERKGKRGGKEVSKQVE